MACARPVPPVPLDSAVCFQYGPIDMQNRWLLRTPFGDFRFKEGRLGRADGTPVEFDFELVSAILFFASCDLQARTPDALAAVMALRSSSESIHARFTSKGHCDVAPPQIEELNVWLERAVGDGRVRIERQTLCRTRAKQRPVTSQEKRPVSPTESAEAPPDEDECLPCQARARASARVLREAAEQGVPFVA